MHLKLAPVLNAYICAPTIFGACCEFRNEYWNLQGLRSFGHVGFGMERSIFNNTSGLQSALQSLQFIGANDVVSGRTIISPQIYPGEVWGRLSQKRVHSLMRLTGVSISLTIIFFFILCFFCCCICWICKHYGSVSLKVTTALSACYPVQAKHAISQLLCDALNSLWEAHWTVALACHESAIGGIDHTADTSEF